MNRDPSRSWSALPTEAWLALGRLRRRRRRGRHDSDPVPAWIRQHAPGRSFADIGCMWGIDGATAFLAEEAGATRATAFDGMPPTERFRDEHRTRDSRVRAMQGDVHDPVSVEEVGEHDVVLCNGVIYHSPSPFVVVEHLRRITGDLLLLGSHTIPEVPGAEQACIFYPGLSDPARRAFARAHPHYGMPGVTEPFDEERHAAYANMWWGITPSALEAMARYGGFDPVERLPSEREPFFTYLVARKTERPPTLPPPELNRLDGERARAEGRLPALPGR